MSLPDLYPRAYQVHLLLKQGRPVNAPRIAKEYGISDRSAHRIFQFLREMWRAPLEYDRHHGSYRYLEPAFDLPLGLMTEGEAVGVILAHEALLRRQGTPLGRQLHKAIDMFRAYLPRSVSVDTDALLNHVLFSPMPARQVADDVLDAAVTALERRNTAHIEYYSPTGNETTTRDINIYHLAHLRGDWYAVAWCCLRRAMRTFALSRIKHIVLQPGRYEIPADFSIEAYFRDGLGVHAGPDPQGVVLEFAPDSSRWVVERLWHPTQHLETLDGGGVTLTMSVVLSIELVRWILSWGGHVEVHAPAKLRDWVVREVTAMAHTYQAS